MKIVSGDNNIRVKVTDKTLSRENAKRTVVESTSVGPKGDAGPQGPQGPVGESGSGEDLPDLTLIFENGLI